MIIFSDHALLKLKQRNIPKSFVKDTLISPDYIFTAHSKRRVIYKRFEKLYLKVIFIKEGNNLFVITAYWEEKPKLIK